MECCHNCKERNSFCHAFCDDYKKAKFVDEVMKRINNRDRDAAIVEFSRSQKIRRIWQKHVQRGRSK